MAVSKNMGTIGYTSNDGLSITRKCAGLGFHVCHEISGRADVQREALDSYWHHDSPSSLI